jgi:hypothetical protein
MKKDASESMRKAHQLQTEENEEEWRQLQEKDLDDGKDGEDKSLEGEKRERRKKELGEKKEKAKVTASGLIAVSEKWGKASDSASRVWEQRRIMFQTQRQRRWEQCLDCMVTLSNYTNAKSNQTSLTITMQKKNLLPMSETSTLLIDSFDLNTSKTKVIEMLKSMVPFLPPDLHTFGTDKAARLLLEITQRVRDMDVTSGQIGQHFQPTTSSPRTTIPSSISSIVPQTDASSKSAVQRQYATATGLRLQSTPFLMRKETEWWRQRGGRSGPRSPRSVARSRQQSPRTNRWTNRRTAAYKRPLEIASPPPTASRHAFLSSGLPMLRK